MRKIVTRSLAATKRVGSLSWTLRSSAMASGVAAGPMAVRMKLSTSVT